ncbi:hypothetical protein [Mucilaginibacter kameinonensis]|uniref:hypothetical protein n=1 Tax=Mucilaginibacter kameinonensis TaxID=452286 RepID=UPI000EF7C7B6|nr:hypothetical protein [Mucilaginibacter kameinonensis]
MSQTKQKAQHIIDQLKQGRSVAALRVEDYPNKTQWHNYSAKAYELNLQAARKARAILETKRPHAATSNKDIQAMIALNEKLADYALLMPIYSTLADFEKVCKLAKNLPNSEAEVMDFVGLFTMDFNRRVHQKIGRFEHYRYFKTFTKLIDAAVLCYYRMNFISCYLTLVPIIEGILIRWMGYAENDTKPEFEDIRKFFKNSHVRQPSPGNILFHQVYIKACDKILNEHFYRPTDSGNSYANFNRHVASHLLNDTQFATRQNCMRLFLLLDTMTEIYYYESHEPDPRFSLSKEVVTPDFELFKGVWMSNLYQTAEHVLLKDHINL